MVTTMSEQSGPREPADQAKSGRPPGDESGRGSRPSRPEERQQRSSQPSYDLVGDLQRWFIRSSARSMRSQFEDQVRRTLRGQRPDKSDVWDVATTEIPPGVGESPECEWCPICRAARRMRDSSPGFSGQISGAGDAVAGAVQDAVRALDSLLTRAGGGSGPSRSGPGGASEGGRDHQAGTDGAGAGQAERPDPPQASSGPAAPPSAAGQADPPPGDAATRPDTLSGEHGPVGWKPGDRLATAGPGAVDPWSTATAGEGEAESPSSGSSPGDEPGGRGHGPGDRG